MISLQLDKTGDLIVVWSQKDTDIILLATSYVNYESSRPTVEQLKDINYELIAAALTEAETSATSAGSGEATRAGAAETVRIKFETAKPLLELAINQLKVKYHANLAQLEEWGLDTVPSGKGVTVRKPRNQAAWITFMGAYIAKEASLPVAAQITDPARTTVQSLYSDIVTALDARNLARNTREIGVEGRKNATQHLLNLLQVACANLVLLKYNGIVTNHLQNWGFTIQARTSPPPPNSEPPTNG